MTLQHTYTTPINDISIDLTFLQAVSVMENSDSMSRIVALRNDPKIKQALNAIEPTKLREALATEPRLDGVDLSSHDLNLDHVLMNACIAIHTQVQAK